MSLPQSAFPTPSSQGQPSVFTLPNGLTVLIKEDNRFPLVSLRLYVHAGSAYETPKEAGISHLLEHMVFKGTTQFPKGAIASAIEQTGGYLNAATSFDYTVYLTDMIDTQWEKGLDVLKDMAFNPTLEDEDLASEKQVVLSELHMGEDSASGRLFKITQQHALKNTPYAMPIIGLEETINAFTSDDIRQYISKHYKPSAMLLVICGNVQTESALEAAKTHFGSLPSQGKFSAPVAIAPESLSGTTAPVISRGPWNKVYLSFSFPVPAFNTKQAAQFDVLAQVLSGDAAARLDRLFHYEKRLVDSISVGNYDFERIGLFYIQAVLDADKLPEFWLEFNKYLAALNNASFSQDELNRAKLNLENELYRSKETVAGETSKLGYFQFFSGSPEAEKQYLQTVVSTTPTDLSKLLRQYLHTDRATAVCILPENAKLEQNGQTPEQWMTTQMQDAWKNRQLLSLALPQEKSSAVPFFPDTSKESENSPINKPEVVDLGNGRTVILQKDTTLPYLSATLSFTGGDSLLTTEQQGLGSFTASLLTKGTSAKTSPEYEEFLSNRAATLNASCGIQSFSVSFFTPSHYSEDLFNLLQETLVQSAFLDSEADRVKENQIAAITIREDQPLGLAFRRIFPFLFPGHPYGYQRLGEKQNIQNFTAATAKKFWLQQLEQPWTLSVCGNFSKENILAAAEKIPAPKAAIVKPGKPVWGKNDKLDLELKQRNQAHLLLIFPTAAVDSADMPGLNLLQKILAGQSGLLFTDLRDNQGLGYSITAFPWNAREAGVLMFYIGTSPELLDKAHQGFLSVLKDLHTTQLTADALERGKNQLLGEYYRNQQTLSARSQNAASLQALGLPLDMEQEQIAKAQKTTAAELQQLAQKYLVPEKAYIVTIKP